jgi:hypothetical protein
VCRKYALFFARNREIEDREAVCRKHIMLACGRIRRKRDGLGVRPASQGEDGVHLMLANPPWRQLRERAEKIPGDKKHDIELEGFSHRVIALRSSIQHRNALAAGSTPISGDH